MSKMIKMINPAFEELEARLLEIPSLFEAEGSIIYNERNKIKLFEVEGHRICVKRYRRPSLFKRFIYSFFRKPKAVRAFVHSGELIRRGFPSPQPVACFIQKKWGLFCDSYYLSLMVDFPRNMYEFGKGEAAGRGHILRAFARLTAELHEAGILHKDYSPGNILFTISKNGIEFCLIDTNRMSFSDYVSMGKGCANFARLWGNDEVFRMIAREYALSRRLNEAMCCAKILRHHRRFWRRYIRKRKKPF
jgi:serine/threonine protein kinase